MAITRNTDAETVKPLEGALTRRRTAGAAIEAGECVTMQSDGAVDPTAAGTMTRCDGIALQDAAAGDVIDVVYLGPVEGYTSSTVGATIYASNTAGEPGESAGTNTIYVGYAESATVLFVQCWI